MKICIPLVLPRLVRRVLVLLALALAACTATIPEGRFVCEHDRECPPYWYCHPDALCYSRPEFARDDAAAPPVDAGALEQRDAGVPVGPDAGAPVDANLPCDAGIERFACPERTTPEPCTPAGCANRRFDTCEGTWFCSSTCVAGFCT